MKRPDTIYTIDFETYYDKDFTLRKLSTTSYIRDSRFFVHGVGVKKNTWKKARWYSAARAELALHALDLEHAAVLCHHTHFDGLILQHHYGIVPAYYLDTLSMARPLHGGEIRNDLNSLAAYYGLGNKLPDILSSTKGVRNLTANAMAELGRYCRTDVELCEELYYRMLPAYPDNELDLIHYTVNMYANPVCQVNKKTAHKEHQDEVAKRQKLLNQVPYSATELRSRTKFPEILREHGVEPPVKISPTTGKDTYAFAKTDQAWLQLQSHDDPTIRTLCQARALVSSNINETRALRLIEHSDPTLPIYLNYGKAHTLRWTGGDKMNPQNFPRDSALRNAIIPPRGHKFVVVDSAQIEARVNAWLAGEEELIEGFAAGEDIYSTFAAEQIYRTPLSAIGKTERFVGKVCILALGYQMGWKKFKHTLNIGAMGPPIFFDNDDEYERIVYAYRNKYKHIKQQWFTMDKLLQFMRSANANEWEAHGPLQFERWKCLLPNNMYLHYPRLRIRPNPDNPDWNEHVYNDNSKIYGGLLTENIVQALARIVVADQILTIADRYRTVLMVHDEVVLCVPTRQAKKALREAEAAFHIPPDWAPTLPVAGEGAVVDYYAKI